MCVIARVRAGESEVGLAPDLIKLIEGGVARPYGHQFELYLLSDKSIGRLGHVTLHQFYGLIFYIVGEMRGLIPHGGLASRSSKQDAPHFKPEVGVQFPAGLVCPSCSSRRAPAIFQSAECRSPTRGFFIGFSLAVAASTTPLFSSLFWCLRALFDFAGSGMTVPVLKAKVVNNRACIEFLRVDERGTPPVV